MDRESRTTRERTSSQQLHVVFDAFRLDEAEARLTQADCALALPPKAFAVLCTLVRHAGRLVPKDALLDAVWGHRHVTESVLKSTISQVRAALGDDARQPRYVETVSRHGYRFVAAVHPTAKPPPLDPGKRKTPTPFVGRTGALSRLHAAWDDTLRGRCRIVFVSGEAGVGKTTLIDRWLVTAEPGRVARGACIEPYGAGEPFLPMLEALAALCHLDGSLPALMRQVAPGWFLQLPWLHEDDERARLQSMLAGASQDRLLRELGELLQRLSRDQPLVIVLEDLHWSDVSTVRMLAFLARRRLSCKLMLIGSFRSTDLVATDHPLKHLRHELRAQALCDEVALNSLTERDVGDWLQEAWQGKVEERLAIALHAHTDGLPVFVANVMNDLQARIAPGAMDTEACLQALALRVPETLGGIISRQLEQLAAADQAALRAASVRGPTFSVRCVCAVLQADRVTCLEQLNALARTGLWIAVVDAERTIDGQLDAGFRFRHSLYQQAIYTAQSPTDRAEAHARLARDLAQRSAGGESVAPSELALHFERGHLTVDAAHWQAEAAASALTRCAPDEAVTHALHGLRLLQTSPPPAPAGAPLELSLRVTLGVASAQRFGVGSSQALVELERARGLSESLAHSPQHTWLANGLGWMYFSRGDFAEALAQGRAMHDRGQMLADTTLSLCSANLLGATSAYSGHLDEALDWLDQAVEILARGGTDHASARSIVDIAVSVHVYRALVLLHRGNAHEASAASKLAIDRARALRHPMSLCLALRGACQLGIRSNNLPAVTEAATELRELAQTHGLTQSLGPASWYHGWSLARSGQFAAGLAELREGLDAHLRLGMTTGCAMAYGYAGQLCLWQDDLDHARVLLQAGIELARARAETLDQPHLHALMAQVDRLRSRMADARDHERRAVECAERIGAVLPSIQTDP